MTPVHFPSDAGEDLRGIGDRSVVAEILALAKRELRPAPAKSTLEGAVAQEQGIWWRRVVPLNMLDAQERFDLDDVDDFRSQACDYVLLYRQITADEAIKLKLGRDSLIVLRVVHNSEFMRYLVGLR